MQQLGAGGQRRSRAQRDVRHARRRRALRRIQQPLSHLRHDENHKLVRMRVCAKRQLTDSSSLFATCATMHVGVIEL